jgi:hypothetical protein
MGTFIAKHGRTDQTRFRIHKRWFKEPLLVLQVQEKGYFYEGQDCESGYAWRDARVTDFPVTWPDAPTPEVKP